MHLHFGLVFHIGFRPFISVINHMYPATDLGRVEVFMITTVIRALTFLDTINEVLLFDSAL